MSSAERRASSSSEVAREAADWDRRRVTSTNWQDTPEAMPRVGVSQAISIKISNQMLSILKAFARREGIGYQVLMKRWLDERIREECDEFSTRETITVNLAVAEPAPSRYGSAKGSRTRRTR